jgi:YVTN family beta-propeller protein
LIFHVIPYSKRLWRVRVFTRRITDYQTAGQNVSHVMDSHVMDGRPSAGFRQPDRPVRHKLGSLRVYMRSLLTLWLLAVIAQAADPAFAVVEKVAGRVGFYDQAMTRLGEVNVGAFPHEAALSPDRRTLYVSVNGVLWMTEDSMGTNTIAVVDVASMKKIADINLGRFHRPHGIVFEPGTGMLLATTERPFALIVVDPKTHKVIRDFDVRGKSPHMVMLSKDGRRAWVSNTDSNSIAIIDVKSGATNVIGTGEKPQGGVFSANGDRLYIANSDSGRIAVIDTQTFRELGRIQTGKNPGRVAITPDGKTLVYNLINGVGFADVTTNKQISALDLGGRPLSLTMTRDGKRAFAGVQDHDKVFVIDVSRHKVSSVVDLPKGSGPDPVIPIE